MVPAPLTHVPAKPAPTLALAVPVAPAFVPLLLIILVSASMGLPLAPDFPAVTRTAIVPLVRFVLSVPAAAAMSVSVPPSVVPELARGTPTHR
jgi:hypothetical protein